MQSYRYASTKTETAPDAASSEPLTVTSALMLAKGALESLRISIVGEVSEVNAKAGYKAVYFTIKDAKSSLPCMMWLNKYRSNGIVISQGDKVELTGRFSLYPATGRMSFDVSTLRLAGEGELRKRIAQLARALRAEGLMDDARKKSIPAFTERIGIVTSPRGDAVHDVLRTLRRRFPSAQVAVAGIPVEGPGAAEGISDALRFMDRSGCDVILLVRGGGSLESLMPFNDEMLARTIAACTTPIITGIGHEPDTTIADLVADLRASTPTGAAQASCPDTASLLSALDQRASLIHTLLNRHVERNRLLLSRYATRPLFTDPEGLFAFDALSLDRMHERFDRVLSDSTSEYARSVDSLQMRLIRAIPAGLQRDGLRLDSAAERMRSLARSMPAAFDSAIAARAGRLEALSPLSILSRGYSMAQDDEGRIVSCGQDVFPGQTLHVSLSDAVAHCTVDTVTRRSTNA